MSDDGRSNDGEAGGTAGVGLNLFLDDWTTEKIGGGSSLKRNDVDLYTVKALAETVAYSYQNSSFYQEKYEAFSDELETDLCEEGNLEIFEKLPFATPDELRERGMDFLCVKPGDISRIVTLDTGGSTGKPKRVYFTEEDQQLTVDFFENGMQLMADSSDKILILMPAKVPGSIGRLLAEGLRNFGAEAVEYGLPKMGPRAAEEKNREEAERLLKIIRYENITGIVALPTHMEMLAEFHTAMHGTAELDEADIAECDSLKWVLLSAEYVADEVAGKIAEVFGCKIYEHYGMTEMGLGCAVSCGCGEGYHVRESDIYIEIMDPETGQKVVDGEVGEIVFTTLTRKGMPFIRYRTGDFSRWITEPCGCESVLKRLAKVGPRDVVKGYLRGE